VVDHRTSPLSNELLQQKIAEEDEKVEIAVKTRRLMPSKAQSNTAEAANAKRLAEKEQTNRRYEQLLKSFLKVRN